MYQLFYDGEKIPELPNLPKRKTAADIAWGTTGKDARFLTKLHCRLATTAERDRKLLLSVAQKIATHKLARAQPHSVLTRTANRGRGSMTTLPSSSGHSQGIAPILEVVVAMTSNPFPPNNVL